MKILIVNYSDFRLGASNDAYRHFLSLRKVGINVTMLVLKKYEKDPNIFQIKKRKIVEVLTKIDSKYPSYIYRNINGMFSANILPNGVINEINNYHADIIHLHWVARGMIRLEDFKKFYRPLVWTFHDMWPFTGGCHYTWICEKYKTNCEYCPLLGSKKKRDLSYKRFHVKKKIFHEIKNMTIVSPSKWMNTCIKQSPLLKNRPVYVIPNPIDAENQFFPEDKFKIRDIFGLKQNKKYILFAAMNSTSDPRKGFIYLKEALVLLNKNDLVELLILGTNNSGIGTYQGYPVRYLEPTFNIKALRMYYSMADITIVPSVQENLSNVIMESLACGTPVIGFDIGGNRDLIVHKMNGYLVTPYNAKDMANGVAFLLDNEDEISLGGNARETILKKYTLDNIGNKFKHLYKEILKNEKGQ